MNSTRILAAALALLAGAPLVAAADSDAAAQSLMKKSGCFKCHSVDKQKDAPPYREIAARKKSEPDAEQQLFVHLTTHPKVKVDGVEETHDSLKTDDEAEVRAVVRWVLSR
jgi:cytochrome c